MIKLVRVDHRLLHGQVIFSWTKQLSANYIIVADDKVPNDPISMMALSIAKPADCELSIIPFSKVKEVVEKNADKNIMIIVKGPNGKSSLDQEKLYSLLKNCRKLQKSIMVVWQRRMVLRHMVKLSS